MKKISIAALALVVLALVISSCSSTRGMGCPNNPQSNSRFRG